MTVVRKLKDFGLVTQGLLLMSGMAIAYLAFYLKTLITKKILYSESELQQELKTSKDALGSFGQITPSMPHDQMVQLNSLDQNNKPELPHQQTPCLSEAQTRQHSQNNTRSGGFRNALNDLEIGAECLEYCLRQPAGDNQKRFANSSFARDCDGSGIRADRKTKTPGKAYSYVKDQQHKVLTKRPRRADDTRKVT